MQRKLIIIFLVVIMLSVCIVQIPSVSALTKETSVDFFWGPVYEGEITAPRLNLSSVATDLVKKTFGSQYSASVYIEAGLTYNFSFGLHTPYQASMYLSNINPRFKQNATGFISLMPENIYFDMLASSKLHLKVGAMILMYGVKILGGEYPFGEIDLSFKTTIDTEYLSPLGTCRVSGR